MLEFKMFFFELFFTCLNFDQAGKFLDVIETAIDDNSNLNLAIVNSNPIKIMMILIHWIE